MLTLYRLQRFWQDHLKSTDQPIKDLRENIKISKEEEDLSVGWTTSRKFLSSMSQGRMRQLHQLRGR